MKYVLLDGTEIAGDTYAELVADMAAMKLTEPRSLESYMRESSRRAMEMYSAKVDWEDPEQFIRDMIRAGLVLPADQA